MAEELGVSTHAIYDLRAGHNQRSAAHDGELPVGQATIVETLDAAIPFMVSAPTMRIPMNASTTVNAYSSSGAAIRAVKQHNGAGNKPIRSVLCPGLHAPSA